MKTFFFFSILMVMVAVNGCVESAEPREVRGTDVMDPVDAADHCAATRATYDHFSYKGGTYCNVRVDRTYICPNDIVDFNWCWCQSGAVAQGTDDNRRNIEDQVCWICSRDGELVDFWYIMPGRAEPGQTIGCTEM